MKCLFFFGPKHTRTLPPTLSLCHTERELNCSLRFFWDEFNLQKIPFFSAKDQRTDEHFRSKVDSQKSTYCHKRRLFKSARADITGIQPCLGRWHFGAIWSIGGKKERKECPILCKSKRFACRLDLLSTTDFPRQTSAREV